MRNNARRIWASTPQNCVTTHWGPHPLLGRGIAFEKRTSFRGVSVYSQETLYRLSA